MLKCTKDGCLEQMMIILKGMLVLEWKLVSFEYDRKHAFRH
jgi:hypothetical protein